MIDQLFVRLKDLILTLKSPNFQKEVVRKKWNGKRQQLEKDIDKLSLDDRKALEQKYQEWYKETIFPELTEQQKKSFGKEIVKITR